MNQTNIYTTNIYYQKFNLLSSSFYLSSCKLKKKVYFRSLNGIL